MTIYHGVCENSVDDVAGLTYSAGVIILDHRNPARVVYRSATPLWSPASPVELHGMVDRIVFPTGIDPRSDLGSDVFDVYYGMADRCIGVGRIIVPPKLR
jgi:beta-1,2-mannobiose phosphorylase / 1,2-beta-oligomannan phosphorylase